MKSIREASPVGDGLEHRSTGNKFFIFGITMRLTNASAACVSEYERTFRNEYTAHFSFP